MYVLMNGAIPVDYYIERKNADKDCDKLKEKYKSSSSCFHVEEIKCKDEGVKSIE